MMGTELVSVIIPAFNAEPYIRDTLRSVLGQTHQELDVIVVDDGSTDSTAEIVSDYCRSDPRVRLLRQPNLGVATARNHALSQAHGTYLAPVDADDLWHPRKIERQLEIIRRDGPQIGVVYCWVCVIDETGSVIEYKRPRPPGSQAFLQLAGSNFVGCASVPLMRTAAVVSAGGYDADFRRAGAEGCEDYSLYLKLAESWQFALVPDFLVGYRQTAKSMSANVLQMQRSHQFMMQDLVRRHPELPRQIIKTSYRRMGLWLMSNCVRNRKVWPALGLAARVGRQDPLFMIRTDTWRYILRSFGALVSLPDSGSSAPRPGARFLP